MFTIKLYRGDFRQDIVEAESFTILRYDDAKEVAPHAEITAHLSDIKSRRYDIYPTTDQPEDAPPRFSKAIIENRFGKTTEIIQFNLFPTPTIKSRAAA